jgi:hypothetical protein
LSELEGDDRGGTDAGEEVEGEEGGEMMRDEV